MSFDFKNRIQILRDYFLTLKPCALRESILSNLDIIESMPDNEDKDNGIKQIEDYLDRLDL